MKRREFIWKTGMTGLTMTIPGMITSCGKKRRPNIILIMTDDQGYGDLGVHGNEKIKVPNLDRFAQESLEMTRFYVSPMCAPTRASLMTGRYHMRTGVLHTSRGAAKMYGNEVTIAELLAGAGYNTGIFGKWHLGENFPMRPQDQGFQEVIIHKSGAIGQTPDKGATYFKPVLWRNGTRIEPEKYCTDLFFDAAIQFIKSNKKRPFFIYLPANIPHKPYQIAERYSDPYKSLGISDPVAKTYGMLTNFDENFGRLLQEIDELGLTENTIIIFMSDNGPTKDHVRYNCNLRGAKGDVYEGGILSPFFVRWPARIQGGIKIDRIAAHIDILPTLLTAAELSLPKDLTIDGVNLLSLWTGEVKSDAWLDRTLFLQLVKSIIQQPLQNTAVITQRYKLVTYPRDLMTVQFNPDLENPELSLFDLVNDPRELHDISKDRPGVVTELRRLYDQWYEQMKKTRDFQPGVIHVGTEHENPIYLCRYQDGHYIYNNSEPIGWPVKIVSSGHYRITMNWPVHEGGALGIRWQDKKIRMVLSAGQKSGEFQLSAGEGILDVWFENKKGKRIVIKDSSTQGDVIVEKLN